MYRKEKLMPIETDQQYLERVVKEQAEEIERLKAMLVGEG